MRRIAVLTGLTALLVAAFALGASSFLSSAGATGSGGSPKTYYFTWYDSKPENGMNGDWIVIGNLETYDANVDVYFGDETTPRKSLTIAANDHQNVTWDDTMGGPVRVVSQNGASLIVTQRVIYHQAFNEVAAIEQDNLGSSYYFTWYDDKPANGMQGNWILINNADTTQAQVDVYIGPDKMGTYTVDPGQTITPTYFNVMSGPVHVVSNGPKLFVSQRVLCNNGFNEVMGMPESRLDSIYFFTWYDMKAVNSMRGNWVLISNTNDTAIHAQVYIGNDPTPRGNYDIAPHQSATPIYPELMDGPVRVVCTDCTSGQKMLVSQRILYKQSFEEVQGTPPSGLDDRMYFGWYDLKSSEMVGDWLLVANQGVGDSAVDVYIGNSLEPKASYTIGEGDRTTPEYWGVMDGPVKIFNENGKPLLASQRVIYKDSFNELLGLTKQDTGQPLPVPPQMKLFRLNTYWASMSDYESRHLSVDLRIADQGQGTAFGATVTGVTATAGVTVLGSYPQTLGDIPGNGGYDNFTVVYNVPPGVIAFTTSVTAHCTDNVGNNYYYPSE